MRDEDEDEGKDKVRRMMMTERPYEIICVPIRGIHTLLTVYTLQTRDLDGCHLPVHVCMYMHHYAWGIAMSRVGQSLPDCDCECDCECEMMLTENCDRLLMGHVM